MYRERFLSRLLIHGSASELAMKRERRQKSAPACAAVSANTTKRYTISTSSTSSFLQVSRLYNFTETLIKLTIPRAVFFFAGSYGFRFSLTVVASCGRKGSTQTAGGKDLEMRYARNITITELDSLTLVTLRDPWDTIRNLVTYALVDKTLAGQCAGVPRGAVEIRVPLCKFHSLFRSALLFDRGTWSFGGYQWRV